MKTIKYILGVALATMLIACSSDYENYVPETEIPEEPTEAIYFTEDELLVLMQMRNPDNRICIDEASEIALDALDFFGGEINTRSGQARTIAGVTALRGEPATRVTTRSADGSDVKVQMPDTVAFVFNFADDAGFMIVAADTRIESSVLAFVDYGVLDDAIFNPGLAVFLSGLEDYIQYSIIESEALRESLLSDILAKIDKIGVRDTVFLDDRNTRTLHDTRLPVIVTITTPIGPWTTSARVGPLLPVEWGQDFPFNHMVPRTCSNREDGRAPAGCVAVAVAMIMAYWQYPAQIDGHRIDWPLLRRFTARPYLPSSVIRAQPLPPFGEPLTAGSDPALFRDNVARLMERIGHNVGMSYGCDISNAGRERGAQFLRNIGFSGGLVENYSLQSVLNSLNNKQPVLARGNSIRNSFLGIPIWYSGGHAWVIDGYLRKRRQVVTTVFSTIIRQGMEVTTTTYHIHNQYSPFYLHNNWGWDGRVNGFFVSGSFNARRPPDYHSGTRSEKKGNFQFNNQIFPNIRR